ncbi:RDD family protein [Antrihabitans cavernicola]|uniref:RDD family protein n=1 Tax=Antrihabitans cavernicola TaxID=2495913 RepID=A0A5A7SBY9_9NOCA|nr:RDD family protein [Spelaeibacter cavernicola]KAA0023074.1 RDD family protein [Spelaeibacter cavernicola]
MARMTGSWLSGPTAALPKKPYGAEPDKFRGESLGLPQSGPGSLVPTGRRVGALMIDWLMAAGVSAAFLGSNAFGGALSTITLLVWFVVGVAAVTISSFTPGQFFLGISVARIDGPVKVGFVRALARSLLLVFVVPAVITDADGRGMHDRATGTALVRTR